MATEYIVIFHEDERGIARSWSEVGKIVRCKDCKHYWKNKPSDDVPACLASQKDEAFCSEGERREYEID